MWEGETRTSGWCVEGENRTSGWYVGRGDQDLGQVCGKGRPGPRTGLWEGENRTSGKCVGRGEQDLELVCGKGRTGPRAGEGTVWSTFAGILLTVTVVFKLGHSVWCLLEAPLFLEDEHIYWTTI